jgi:hypothetical protein
MGKPISRDQAIEVCRAVENEGTVVAAARALGISRGGVEQRLRTALNEYGLAPGACPADDESAERVRELEVALRTMKQNELTTDYVKRQILKLASAAEKSQSPEWAIRAQRGKKLPGVPVALWSDWHVGEIVDPAQVNGVNAFDMQIFERRARKLVERTIYLLRHHVVNPEYPGIVVNLGGDMLTGDIHEELTATNAKPTLAALLDLHGVLKWALKSLADEFGRVFVPCVPGNHGRLSKKPRAKDRAFTNLDWLLYQFLAKAFEADDRITFHIPDGPDALYNVCGHRYLLTHGDQFRGGDGIIGAIGPITRGNQKKQARNSAINLDYDTMLLGHWHQYMPLHRTLVNGSLKGYDEYANQNNFGYEPPIQALWLTHPEHGITMHLPVYLEPHAGRQDSREWVSWTD